MNNNGNICELPPLDTSKTEHVTSNGETQIKKKYCTELKSWE